jgi:GPH family glycoside/pentoside/hexuronide:cation symporter
MTDVRTIPATDRIPFGIKIAYGGAEGASSLVFTMLAIYFMIFLTDVVRVHPSTAGIIFFVAVMWDALTDPVMGIISDRTRSRYGRRRPYILAAAIPFGIIFWLLFSVPQVKGYMLVGYYILMALLMHTAITVLDVPYTALAPEMTRDYDERTSLVSFRVVWSQVGSIVAAAIPYLIVQRFADEKAGWSVAAAAFGLLCLFPILITWRFTRGWERYSEDSESLSFRDVAQAILGNRSFRYITGIYLFSVTAVYVSGAVAVYFLEYWMEFSETQISWFLLFYFGCTVLWVPVITVVSNRLGKRGAFILFMALWAFTYGIGNLIVQPHQVAVMYVLAVFGSIGAGTSFQLCWAMIPDVVEVDEFKTGRRREGLYYGVAIFTLKAGSAIALLIVGQVIERIGYVPNAVQSASALMGLRIMFGPLIAGLIIISIIIAFFMPMTRERHRALREAIETKKAGGTWDEDGFRELL